MTAPAAPAERAEIAAAVEAASAALVDRAVGEVEQDPFWVARFGSRGRTHTRRDHQYHLHYLAEAVRAGSPDPLRAYARWLRGVLVPRGVGTVHLTTTFGHLAGLLTATAVTGAPLLASYLGAACDALAYDGAAGEVQRAVPSLVEDASDGAGHTGRAAPYHLLVYLVDALGVPDAGLLAAHLRWLDGSGSGAEPVRPAQRVQDVVTPVARAIARATTLSPDAAAMAGASLAAAWTLTGSEAA